MQGQPAGRIGHFDAGFGISGDMALGALLDAGARLEAVNAALAALGVAGLRVEAGRALRCGLACARVAVRWDGDGADAAPPPSADHDHAHVHEHGAHYPHEHGHDHGHAQPHDRHADHAHRSFRDIRALLQAAALPEGVRARALRVFSRLAEAEGRIHGRPAEDVHFHEVGGQDALGDVVGVAAALEDLGIGALSCSPLPAGGGTVRAAHGLLPVPAPAVGLLLEGFEVRPGPVAAELVTPTGAAVVSALAAPASGWPALRLRGSGWGAGARDFPGHPNACRFVWGDPVTTEANAFPGVPPGVEAESLVELETNLDDQTPEQIGHLYEQLFSSGALDVATAPLWMKKQRPGVRLWALARPADVADTVRCVFRESSALGLRLREVRRWSLPRTLVPVSTPYGEVRVKVGLLEGEAANAAPEYEDCRAAAARAGVPLKAVMAAALSAWGARAAAGA